MTVTKNKLDRKSCSPLRRAAIEEAKGWAVVIGILILFFLTRGVFQ